MDTYQTSQAQKYYVQPCFVDGDSARLRVVIGRSIHCSVGYLASVFQEFA